MINRNRQATFARKAELLSGVGAVVLGGGIALLWPDVLLPFATQLLIVGIVLHSGGMYLKHRAEGRSGLVPPRWESVAYWSCWAALLLLAAYVAGRAGGWLS